MKKFILIMVLLSLAIWGCDDSSSKPLEFYSQKLSSSSSDDFFIESSSSSVNEPVKTSEVLISEDCTSGDEIAGIEFDSDSVRCGRKGDFYLGLDLIDETNRLSPIGFYLFADIDAKTTKDSLWFFESDSVAISTCKKLNFPNMDKSGVFCLKKTDGIVGRERVAQNTFFIYKKYKSYSAFCNAVSIDCFLYYSCVVRYDGIFDFSKIPDADDVKRNGILGCII